MKGSSQEIGGGGRQGGGEMCESVVIAIGINPPSHPSPQLCIPVVISPSLDGWLTMCPVTFHRRVTHKLYSFC